MALSSFTLNSWGVGQFVALLNQIHSFGQESAYREWTPNQVVLESNEKVKKSLKMNARSSYKSGQCEGRKRGIDDIVGKTGDYLPRIT